MGRRDRGPRAPAGGPPAPAQIANPRRYCSCESMANLAPAVHACPVDEIEPHLVGQHIAYGVEVAGVETIDVGGEQRAAPLAARPERQDLGLGGNFAKPLAAAVQRRLHGRNAGVRHPADLVQGIAEHIHQDDTAALGHREAHEGPQTRGRELAILRRTCCVDNHVRVLVGAGGIVPGALAQKINGCIVRDAKQPALGVGDRSVLGKCRDRLHQRFLDDVLAINHRPGHARAITMQLRPQRAEKLIERRAGFSVRCRRCAHAHCLIAVMTGQASDSRPRWSRRRSLRLLDATLRNAVAE